MERQQVNNEALSDLNKARIKFLAEADPSYRYDFLKAGYFSIIERILESDSEVKVAGWSDTDIPGIKRPCVYIPEKGVQREGVQYIAIRPKEDAFTLMSFIRDKESTHDAKSNFDVKDKEVTAAKSRSIAEFRKILIDFIGTNFKVKGLAELADLEVQDIDEFRKFGGQSEALRETREVVNQINNRRLFEKWGVEIPRGILLYGPPGNGKTLLTKIIAAETDSVVVSAKAGKLLSHYQAKSAENTLNLFEKARKDAKDAGKPAIVFIEEVDSLMPVRDHSSEAQKLALGTLLTELDGFDGRGNVIVVASTNRVELLDTAFLSRMSKQICLKNPDANGVAEIVRIHLQQAEEKSGRQISSEHLSLDRLIKRATNVSGRDINDFVQITLKNKAHVEMMGAETSLVDEQDLIDAYDEFTKTVIS